jgi:beta-xylosidase
METTIMKDKPLITHMFTADPSANVFQGKLYIYPSHDLDVEATQNDNGDQYTMEDYHVFSMDTIPGEVTDHGMALHMKDVPWVSQQMWAPDAAEKEGIFYLYFPARDKDGLFRIGVATSDKPSGPFIPEDNYIPGSYSIDPCVFQDHKKYYLYFGGLWGGQLEKWTGNVYDPNGKEPGKGKPAEYPKVALLSEDMKSFDGEVKDVKILDNEGNPLDGADEDRRYFEGPWMHKYKDTYYLSYSTGTTHKIVYATSKSPTGPFTYQGVILEPVIGWTTHHSIVEYKGKWYLFYHDSSLSGGLNHKRSVKVSELEYNEDGSIRTIIP